MAKRIVDPETSGRPFAGSGSAGKLSPIAAGHIVPRHEIMGVLLAVYVYLSQGRQPIKKRFSKTQF